MKAIIDLILVGILAICIWSGYKKGLIMGVGGVLCIIVSIYGANLLANTFSHDIVPALKPFATGYTEKLISGEDSPVLKQMGWTEEARSVEDLLAAQPAQRAPFCAACYRALGVSDAAAEVMARRAVTYAEETGSSVWTAVGQILCETVSYAACFVLAFLLLIIILTVIGNLPNLNYKLPSFDLVNDIGGAVLGLVTGLMFCVIVVWALKFMGMILGGETLSSTGLGGWLLRKDFLLKYLGI